MLLLFYKGPQGSKMHYFYRASLAVATPKAAARLLVVPGLSLDCSLIQSNDVQQLQEKQTTGLHM